MFSEEQLLSQLHQTFPGDHYIFQVIKQKSIVEIYLNYKGQLRPDPQEIALEIEQAIATFDWSQTEQVYILGRALGVTEPEWDVPLTLNAKQAQSEKIQTRADDSDSADDPGNTDAPAPNDSVPQTVAPLSDYCFTRNKSLITTEILPPSEAVAQLIQQFSKLTTAHQHQLLPQLDAFFRGKGTIARDEDPVQCWVQSYSDLAQNERRKATIWLSRYCTNPDKTVSEIQAVLNPSTQQSAESQSNDAETSETPEHSAISQLTHSTDAITDLPHQRPQTLSQQSSSQPQTRKPSNISPSTPRPYPPIEQTQRRAPWITWLLPAVWTVCTFFFVIYDVQALHGTDTFTQLCKGSDSTELCQLTGQLIGAEDFKTVIDSGESFEPPDISDVAPPDPETIGEFEGQEALMQLIESHQKKGLAAMAECSEAVQFNTGHFRKDMQDLEPQDSRLLSFKTNQVKPGVFLLRMRYPHKTTQENITTACAIGANAEETSFIHSDIIPNDWPNTAYRKSGFSTDLPQTSVAFSKLSRLGTGTLFSGLGILCAAFFGLAIRVDTLNALYLSAFVLGFIEAALSLPIFGGPWISGMIMGGMAMSLTLGTTSYFIKGIELDWSAGSLLVLSGALSIIAVKKILYFVLIYSIEMLMALG